jgi:hypothetical protein|tara:strand:+ start:343 stop:1548 length:1206 start_codon:yes stop_codon:yes gene_type:complete
MPTVLQFRRGTTTQNNAFTGSAGEVSIDTDLDTIRVHDGSTAGGFTLTQNAATQTLTNKTLTSPVLTTPTVATSITINAAGELRFGDSDTSNYVGFKSPGTVGSNVIWTLPSADGSSGQALVTDASGNLSFAAAGATISADTSTNTNFLLYFASTTSGALTAVKQDSGLIYNPSTGSLSSAVFIGALTGNADTCTTASAVAANSVALGTDTTGNYVATGAVSGTGLSGSSSSEGGTFTVTSNATSANTASTIIARDGSGNFTANVATLTATAARYADLAERYTADADYEPGTVVELGGEQEVTQTTRPISVAIAGIVSTDPAYLMNADLTDGISVALIGRVPCKVIGIIHKGDILVSSLTPGHAEAHRDIHSPPAGSVIGKAIESKSNDGSGVIEVLVGRL